MNVMEVMRDDANDAYLYRDHANGGLSAKSDLSDSVLAAHSVQEMIDALRLAQKYLDHPDVKAIHFVRPAESVSAQIGIVLERAGVAG